MLDDFDRLEAEWLSTHLNPNRKPDPDPLYEMLGDVARLKLNLRETSGRAVARMDLSPKAARTILKSPIMHSTAADVLARAQSGCYSIQLMGIPVVLDDTLPDGLVVFLDSKGDPVQMLILTDTPTSH